MPTILVSTGDNIPENLLECVRLAGLFKIYRERSEEWNISLHRNEDEESTHVCIVVATLFDTKEFVKIFVDPETKIIITELTYCNSLEFKAMLLSIIHEQIRYAQVEKEFAIYADCHRDQEDFHPHYEGMKVKTCGYDIYGEFGYEMTNGIHIDTFRAIMARHDCHSFKRITTIYDSERFGYEKAKRAWKEDGTYWVGTYFSIG